MIKQRDVKDMLPFSTKSLPGRVDLDEPTRQMPARRHSSRLSDRRSASIVSAHSNIFDDVIRGDEQRAQMRPSSRDKNNSTTSHRNMSSEQQQVHSRRNSSGTSHISSKSQRDELLMSWPTNHDKPARYPTTILSEHAPAVAVNNRSINHAKNSGNNNKPRQKKSGGMVNSTSLPDMLDLADLEPYPPRPEQEQEDVPMRRHSSSSMKMLSGTCTPLNMYYRPKTRGSNVSRSKSSTRTKSSRPSSSSSSSRQAPSQKKSVKISDNQTFHIYEYPSGRKISDLFYSRTDDVSFSDATVKHARAVRSYIKNSITHDSTFNSLTGLPSPQVLKKHLISPEDIIGIEHLLCARGIARASLALKTNHAQLLLEEQRAGTEFNELGCKLRKYSEISAKLAVCRASYAAMF
mmetsp:Transcript_25127/g.54175  ORF Transcript_25127/g.54175 Transcript_25127/m.54175 type:complete len:405 (-) Transcript_25127:113-1327(-)